MKYPQAQDFENTLSAVCIRAYQDAPDRELLHFKADDKIETWSCHDIMQRALFYANQIISAGTNPGDQVAVMLDNHPDHVAVMISLAMTGAIWLPLDRRFTAANIQRVLTQVDVSLSIVEYEYSQRIREAGFNGPLIHPHDNSISNSPADQQELSSALLALVSENPRKPDDTRALLFTSGTTGPPKGVIVTERMFIASALFCGHASEANASTIFYLWEPLNHIGGAQIIPMALLAGCTVAMSRRFSVTHFWSEVVEMNASRIHYLGGIVELLLRKEATNLDRQHGVTLGFGAGASEPVRRAFKERFGVPLREVYGMTEASSFTTMNFDGPLHSIGKPLPDFQLVILDDSATEVESGQTGEICIKPIRSKLITAGYYKNEAATVSAFRNGYFCTGDLAWQDNSGNLYFVGRQKELIRCKGENVSAWEVESVFKKHVCVLEVAVMGVDSTVAEQDIVAFVRLVKQTEDEYRQTKSEIKALLTQELASFQQPKYVIEVSQFPKTPSERIEKHKLDRSSDMLQKSWSM